MTQQALVPHYPAPPPPPPPASCTNALPCRRPHDSLLAQAEVVVISVAPSGLHLLVQRLAGYSESPPFNEILFICIQSGLLFTTGSMNS